MKKFHVLVVDERFEVCQKVVCALATRFRGLNFSNEKSTKQDAFVVKFYEVNDVDQQYFSHVCNFAGGFYEAIRDAKSEKVTSISNETLHHYRNLGVGDVFSFVTPSGVSSTKYLKLAQNEGLERTLCLYTNQIQHLVDVDSLVAKDEVLTTNRTTWVQSLSKIRGLKFGDLDVGDVFYFSSSTNMQYMKVSPSTGSSRWVQCIRLSTSEPCALHDDAIVHVNTLATDENDAAMVENQETLLP